jgi:hypothetical protein
MGASVRSGPAWHPRPGRWHSPDSINRDLIKRNGVGLYFGVTYKTGQAQDTIPLLREVGVQQFIVRATHDGHIGTSEDFVSRTIPLLKPYYDILGPGMMIQVSNEVNLVDEGWGSAYKNGSEFAAWFLKVVAAFRAAFPGCKLGFPPMSPGGDATGVRTDEQRFVNEAQAAIDAADWVGVHYYWQDPAGADIKPPFAMWRKQFSYKPIVATEVGPTAALTTGALTKAYDAFKAGGIPCCMWILDSDGDPKFDNASWRKNNVTLPGQPVTPAPSKAVKLDVGIHYMPGGPNKEILDLARTLFAAGKGLFVKLCKSANFSGGLTVKEIKDANPLSVVIVRPDVGWQDAYPIAWDTPDLRAKGQEVGRAYWKTIQADPDYLLADFHEIECEPGWGKGHTFILARGTRHPGTVGRSCGRGRLVELPTRTARRQRRKRPDSRRSVLAVA